MDLIALLVVQVEVAIQFNLEQVFGCSWGHGLLLATLVATLVPALALAAACLLSCGSAHRNGLHDGNDKGGASQDGAPLECVAT